MRDVRTELSNVPVRLVSEHPPAAGSTRGTVLFYHGLDADIAGQTNELVSLARAGYLAVGVDAVGHGHRRWPDFERRFSGRGTRSERTFLDVVKQTTDEIPRLIDDLIARGWANPAHLALGGISMGGYIAYAAVLKEPRLRVVTPILGSPRWKLNDQASPHRRPEAFPPVALLAQNAGDDEAVPPRAAREFHKRLQNEYEATPNRLDYREFAGCGHFMPADCWHQLWDNVLDWLARHL